MRHRHSDGFEAVSRPVVALGNDYPPSFELATHTHRRGQLLHASAGVIAVSTPQGAWVVPPQRAIWIPGSTPHSVRMVGAVSTHSVLIEPATAADLGQSCRVVAVSVLLRALLLAAADLPLEYDERGRDGMVANLLVAEISRAPTIPLAVPFPASPRLAARCHRFLEQPDASETIDAWADELAIHRRRFTRLFRRETGMSFAAWRQQACLCVAIPRLAAGESVTTIALDLGYESPSTFSSMFKRVLGMSPSRYRS